MICLGTVYGNIDIHASDKSVRLKPFLFSNYFVSSWLTQLVGRFYKTCSITFFFNAFSFISKFRFEIEVIKYYTT